MPDAAVAATPPPAAAGVPPGPTGPATTAPQSGGMQMRGRVLVSLGLKMLSQAAGMIGAQSPEGQVLMGALAKLGKTFGEANSDLGQQEVKMLGQQVAPVGQPTPQQGQQFQQMIAQRNAAGGIGGGAPGG